MTVTGGPGIVGQAEPRSISLRARLEVIASAGLAPGCSDPGRADSDIAQSESE